MSLLKESVARADGTARRPAKKTTPKSRKKKAAKTAG
jgi:hypothetical protein